MNRLGTLLSSAAVLALVCGVAANAKPTKVTTQACTLLEDGDASGEGDVGIDVRSYGPLAMNILRGGLETLFVEGGFSPNGAYSGPGRVLKRQGRLDFYFDLPDDRLPAGRLGRGARSDHGHLPVPPHPAQRRLRPEA